MKHRDEPASSHLNLLFLQRNNSPVAEIQSVLTKNPIRENKVCFLKNEKIDFAQIFEICRVGCTKKIVGVDIDSTKRCAQLRCTQLLVILVISRSISPEKK